MSDTRIMARVPQELLDDFAAVASRHERSVSGALRLAMKEHIAKNSEGVHAGTPPLDTKAGEGPRHAAATY